MFGQNSHNWPVNITVSLLLFHIIQFNINFKAINLGQGFPTFSPLPNIPLGLSEATLDGTMMNQYSLGFTNSRKPETGIVHPLITLIDNQ